MYAFKITRISLHGVLELELDNLERHSPNHHLSSCASLVAKLVRHEFHVEVSVIVAVFFRV